MFRVYVCLGILTASVGCGGSLPAKPLPKTVPAAGLITLSGQPLSFATVTFVPKGQTNGIESVGVTDEKGQYSLKQVRGEDGVPPGDYTVVINRYVKTDGTPVRLDGSEPPANLGAVESLPPQYSNPTESILLAKVTDAGGEFKFELKGR